jgi:hypothetical protein
MGRHPTGKIPSQPLGIIMSKHREIMRRLVAGESQHRIAAEIGMTECRLSIICNSPLFKRELAALEEEVKSRYITTTADIQGRINKLQPRAVDILDQILNKTEVDGRAVTLPLKRDVALDVLELAGSGKKKNATVADAMGDVVKIIADGFKLAKELKDAAIAEGVEAQRQTLHSASNIQHSTPGLHSTAPHNGTNGTIANPKHTIISSGVANIHSYPANTPTSDVLVDNGSNSESDSPGQSDVHNNNNSIATPDESIPVYLNIAPTIVNMEDTEYNITDAI